MKHLKELLIESINKNPHTIELEKKSITSQTIEQFDSLSKDEQLKFITKLVKSSEPGTKKFDFTKSDESDKWTLDTVDAMGEDFDLGKINSKISYAFNKLGKTAPKVELIDNAYVMYY